jgi:hypothetical protein
MNWIFITIISSLISGIVGVVISIIYHKRAEERSLKFETLRNLFGYKYQLSLGVGNRNEFNKAINEIPVIFHKSKEVLIAHKNLTEALSTKDISVIKSELLDDKFITLFKNMFHDLGIEIEDHLNDADFLKTMS